MFTVCNIPCTLKGSIIELHKLQLQRDAVECKKWNAKLLIKVPNQSNRPNQPNQPTNNADQLIS